MMNENEEQLVDLVVAPEYVEKLKLESNDFLTITLTQRQLCDLELLMNGAFTPVDSFMGKADYDSVVENLHLSDGTLWPIPIVLDINDECVAKIKSGDKISLRDCEGFMLAVLTVDDIWQPDKVNEAQKVYGTDSVLHPGVRHLFENINNNYISGKIEGLELPVHYDFENLWDTPRELRALFSKMGWRRVVSFQTSKPVHQMQREVTLQAAKEIKGNILLHPAVGMTKPGDIHYCARVHCYQAALKYYPHNLALLSLLPVAMRMAGPREALWHAIINQNYGCTHMIIGPKHAYPRITKDEDNKFYHSGAAGELITEYEKELSIDVIQMEEMRYVPTKKAFLPASEINSNNLESAAYTDLKLKEDLLHDKEIPSWFSYPEVICALRKVYPSRKKGGFTLFFTGLSGSGKSTLANIIYARLVESADRPVTLLDGDVVRLNLSSELGFSKEHRDINVKRIGFVASEITKNKGVAICAPIAPYMSTRRVVRQLIEQHGSFIEVHVATPLETCESRDRKGLYAKARQGIIPEFTGISDPYEIPESPEISIDTSLLSPKEAAQEIYLYLLREGYIDYGSDDCA